MKPNFIDAIYKLYPQVTTTVNDIAYDADGNAIAYNLDDVQAYVDNHAYIANRQAEYPSIVDQLDTLYHSGLDAWKAQIKTVKDKYPKA
jgi:hypothetical protein